MKVGFISLGCSKNLVVTEEMIGLFKKHGYTIVNDEKEAEVLIINTCGFIDSAKQEGIDTILEMANYKKENCKYLIVTGCLVERYIEELKKELPEVDLFIPINNYDELWQKIDNLVNNKQTVDKLNFHNRVISTGDTMAYLKIAEGCSNYCTFCAIPYIQGKYISREYEDILLEAEELAGKGISELVVIAQDTTKYGTDLYGKSRLAELLGDLSKIEGIKWIRFLYSYPENITDELINVVKNNEKICNYFDIPIQHINDRILKLMNRKSDGDSIRKLVKKIRKEIPDVIIRTTLIVGFPTETHEEFLELYEFVKEAKFDRLGAFSYSREEGTAASKIVNQIDDNIKEERKNKIMELQQDISKEKMKEKIGKTYNVIIENMSDDGEYFIGRSYMDVPSEDGVIYVDYDDSIFINDYLDVLIYDGTEYDLYAKIIKKYRLQTPIIVK